MDFSKMLFKTYLTADELNVLSLYRELKELYYSGVSLLKHCYVFLKHRFTRPDFFKDSRFLFNRKFFTNVSGRRTHTHHVAAPSAIPFFVAFFLYFFLDSLLLSLEALNENSVSFYFFLFLLSCSSWFFLLRKESSDPFISTSSVKANFLTGFIIFILSEVMVFFSLFWSFFHYSFNPSIFIGRVWPPVGIEVVDPYSLPIVNTFLLLFSGFSANAALFSFNAAFVSSRSKHPVLLTHLPLFVKTDDFWESQRSLLTFFFSRFMLISLLFGYLFWVSQLVEYSSASFSINDSVYGSIFYAITGLHGLHVLVGLIILFLSYLVFSESDINKVNSTPVLLTISLWYWHFVDIVWLFVYLFIYVLGV